MPRAFRPPVPGQRGAWPAFVVALLLAGAAGLGPAIALPADPAHGEQLAKRWCASCHVVAADQVQGADNTPPFASIARKPGFSAGKVAGFLMDPHPKMPDMQLSRD